MTVTRQQPLSVVRTMKPWIRNEEVRRTRIIPVRSSTYAFSLSTRSVSGLYFLVFSTAEGRVGDIGDRGMSRPNISVSD